MLWGSLANLLLVLHLGFVIFVVAGGWLCLRDLRWAWLHLPAAIWGALVELQGWICPLTPWENHLRRLAGQAGYEGGFIEEVLLAWLYPGGLERHHQVALGSLVIGVNLIVYVLAYRRWRGRHRPPPPPRRSDV